MLKRNGYCRFCARMSKDSLFCSPECRRKYVLRNQRFRMNPTGRLCPVCGDDIPAGLKKTCSKACTLVTILQERVKAKTMKPCPRCGKEFLPCSAQKYCGKECAEAAKIALIHERQQHNKKQTTTVQAVCPKCKQRHTVKLDVPFVGTNTPRLRCSSWPNCSSGDDDSEYIMSYLRQMIGPDVYGAIK